MRWAWAIAMGLAVLCNAADEKREKRIIVPVTASELKAIEKAATESHLDVPDFVRVRAMEGIEVEKEDVPAKAVSEENKKATADADSGESPLKGWKVVTGKWTKEKDGICCKEGRLQWEGDVAELIEIEFYVTVRKWLGSSTASVGLMWNTGDMQDNTPDPNKPRNLALITVGHVMIWAQPERPDAPRQNIPYTIPLNQPLRIRAIISKHDVQITVGKQVFSKSIRSEDLWKLQLHVGNADVVFGKVKVKAE
ncbi:MAG: hypothetical protein AB1696_04695 [Planctomycetota bacterium]